MGYAPRASWPRTAWTSSECWSAARDSERLGAYLELHIEQGPVLEAEGIKAAAVTGCAGVERHRFVIRGRAAHAGTTPMDARHDAGLAAAAAALRIEEIARDEGGVGTVGVVDYEPGIVTAVAGIASMQVDLRHRDADALARMIAFTRDAVAQAATERGCETSEEPIWRIEPIAFDPELVASALDACARVTGTAFELPSGALHDAASMARTDARRDDLLRRRSAASATPARRTPPRMTSARRSRRSARS